jgi:hypothetical protein
LRSQIMCICDRGIYFGWFSTFEEIESGDTPFQFKLSWEFKVSQTVYNLPWALGVDVDMDSDILSDIENMNAHRSRTNV